jgi:hypothetical protein
MNIEARAGPIELLTVLNILFISIVTPANSLGDARIILLIEPTAANIALQIKLLSL